jgi:ribosomal protein S27AE
MVTIIAIGAGVVLALAFVLAPLVRSETDLQPLRRQRPGTRHLRGLSSVDVEVLTRDTRQCPHCGATVDAAFDFCGECASPLP